MRRLSDVEVGLNFALFEWRFSNNLVVIFIPPVSISIFNSSFEPIFGLSTAAITSRYFASVHDMLNICFLISRLLRHHALFHRTRVINTDNVFKKIKSLNAFVSLSKNILSIPCCIWEGLFAELIFSFTKVFHFSFKFSLSSFASYLLSKLFESNFQEIKRSNMSMEIFLFSSLPKGSSEFSPFLFNRLL